MVVWIFLFNDMAVDCIYITEYFLVLSLMAFERAIA